MRVGVALEGAELSREPRPCRIGEIEDETLSGPEAVGEELPVRRHLVLGVVRAVPAAWYRQRRDQSPIPVGVLGHVEDGQEIWLGGIGRRRPEIEVLCRYRRRLSRISGACQGGKQCAG